MAEREAVCLRRRSQLEQALQNDQLTEAEKQKQREDFEKREREYTRFQRTRMTAADFEPLTVIGRGAFGEVPRPPCNLACVWEARLCQGFC